MRYDVVEGWEQLPKGYEHRDVAGVAVDGEDRVFLICRGRDGLNARGCRKNPLFHDQVVGGVLAEHHPRVEPWLMGQEIRQSLRKSRVRQAVEASLR